MAPRRLPRVLVRLQVRLRALVMDGKYEAALREATWLASNRGRAYGEQTPEYFLQPANVLESDLAVLAIAELAGTLGRPDLAARRSREFARIWPTDEMDPVVAARRALFD